MKPQRGDHGPEHMPKYTNSTEASISNEDGDSSQTANSEEIELETCASRKLTQRGLSPELGGLQHEEDIRNASDVSEANSDDDVEAYYQYHNSSSHLPITHDLPSPIGLVEEDDTPYCEGNSSSSHFHKKEDGDDNEDRDMISDAHLGDATLVDGSGVAGVFTTKSLKRSCKALNDHTGRTSRYEKRPKMKEEKEWIHDAMASGGHITSSDLKTERPAKTADHAVVEEWPRLQSEVTFQGMSVAHQSSSLKEWMADMDEYLSIIQAGAVPVPKVRQFFRQINSHFDVIAQLLDDISFAHQRMRNHNMKGLTEFSNGRLEQAEVTELLGEFGLPSGHASGVIEGTAGDRGEID